MLACPRPGSWICLLRKRDVNILSSMKLTVNYAQALPFMHLQNVHGQVIVRFLCTDLQAPLPTVEHVGIHVKPITHCGKMDVQWPLMPHLMEPTTHYSCVDVQGEHNVHVDPILPHVQGPLLIMQHKHMYPQVVQQVDMHIQGSLSTLQYGDLHEWNRAIKTHAKAGSSEIAFQLFEQLQQEGKMPEKHTFTSIVFGCTSHDGKRMHARIFHSVYGCDPVVNTALLNMYGKQGNLGHAVDVFDNLTDRDVVAWSAIISVNAQHGKSAKALQFFYQMLEECLMPDKIAIVCVLDACMHVSVKERLWMYVYIVNNRYEDDVAVGTALLSLCGKCNNLDMSIETFKKMTVCNVRTWSAMIAVHVQHAQGMKALQLFYDMHEQGVLPNEITFVSVLTACILEGNVCAGQQLHACMVGCGLKMDLPLGNSLLNFYGKCGKFQDAERLFHALSKLDVITFTTMIAACASHAKVEELSCYVSRMVSSGHIPDPITLVSILEACVKTSGFPVCKHVHSFMVEWGYDLNVILANALLNAYCKHSDVPEVQWVFDRMLVRDVISWDAVISLHAQQGQMQVVMQLHQQMQQEDMVDNVTFLHMMDVLTGHAALNYGKCLHTQVLANGLQSEISVCTALVSMYGRCGSLKLAYRVFNELQDRDLILWNAMVSVCAQLKQNNEADQLLDRLLLECLLPDNVCFICFLSAFSGHVAPWAGKRMHVRIWNSPYTSDIAVNNALVNMYGHCGSLEDGKILFNRMHERNAISWNTVISLCNLHKHFEEVNLVSDKMIWDGHMPDKIVRTSHLAACAGAMNLAQGKRVHACIYHNNMQLDGVVSTALLNMYGKCGNWGLARSIFDQLLRPTVFSWNAMLAVYAQHGLGKEALELFYLLCQKLLPDRATFASVLSACDHSGLLLDGCRIFASMHGHGFTPSPEDLSCITHLLGRVGNLDEAENFIKAQPLDATSKSLFALLSTCRHQRDVERGERAAEQLFHLDKENAATYVLLSNLYAEGVSDSRDFAMVAEG